MEVTEPVIATQAIMKLKPSIVITNLHLHRSKGLVIWWMAINPFAHRRQMLSGREEGGGGGGALILFISLLCQQLVVNYQNCLLPSEKRTRRFWSRLWWGINNGRRYCYSTYVSSAQLFFCLCNVLNFNLPVLTRIKRMPLSLFCLAQTQAHAVIFISEN